jgi:hypothetical protein
LQDLLTVTPLIGSHLKADECGLTLLLLFYLFSGGEVGLFYPLDSLSSLFDLLKFLLFLLQALLEANVALFFV